MYTAPIFFQIRNLILNTSIDNSKRLGYCPINVNSTQKGFYWKSIRLNSVGKSFEVSDIIY